jgi:hypothetical protein
MILGLVAGGGPEGWFRSLFGDLIAFAIVVAYLFGLKYFLDWLERRGLI